MSYSFDSRIRYSEVGEDGRLDLSGMIDYFQDACIFQSEDAGLGVDVLWEKRRFWVLVKWQIIVERYPRFGECVEVATWPYSFKGFLGKRNFTMKSRDGEMLAYADSLWTFMDWEKGRPAHLTPEFTEAYQIEPKLDMEYGSRKVPVPEGCIFGEPFPVRPCHLDSNHHVNNGQHVKMAMEMLPRDFEVSRMHAEYRRQAVLGDVIVPGVFSEEEKTTVVLCSEDKEAYSVMEFFRKG